MLVQYLFVTPDQGEGTGGFPVVCRPLDVVSKAREVLAATGAPEVQVWAGRDYLYTITGEAAD